MMGVNATLVVAAFAAITAFLIAAASIVRAVDQANAHDRSQDSYFDQHWGD